MTPVWKNEDLEGAVIGAIFLRGADPEVLDILSGCRPPLSRYRSIGKYILGSAVRRVELALLTLYCSAKTCQSTAQSLWIRAVSHGPSRRLCHTLPRLSVMQLFVMPKL